MPVGAVMAKRGKINHTEYEAIHTAFIGDWKQQSLERHPDLLPFHQSAAIDHRKLFFEGSVEERGPFSDTSRVDDLVQMKSGRVLAEGAPDGRPRQPALEPSVRRQFVEKQVPHDRPWEGGRIDRLFRRRSIPLSAGEPIVKAIAQTGTV
jgi:hypothetical protein